MEIAILGAGAGGLCTAMQLVRHGIRDFTIYEKSDGVGGTWRDNSYPGAGCDVPSHLYSFSFFRNRSWSRAFAEQPEILAYFERCADRFGLRPHLRTGCEITEVRWLEHAGRWQLTTATGDTHEADVVVSGLGQLNTPSIPALPGLDSFAGDRFHSARWRHDLDLTGRRVGVIGTGASAVQFVPRVAQQAAELSVFQRSANWIVPKPDMAFGPGWQRAFELVPGLDRAYRSFIWASFDVRIAAFKGNERAARMAAKTARDHLHAQVPEGPLRDLLTPDYPIGCKRILISNDYYPALQLPHVEVVTDAIERVTPAGIVTADGTERAFDTLIFGTGFQTTRFLTPMEVVGRDGATLHDTWARGAEAYLGMTVAGFPNFFMLYGPNTNLAHNSILFMIECQVRYLLQCVEQLRQRGGGALEVTAPAYHRQVEATQAELEGTVWSTGCTSWYKNESGRITNNWSASTATYWRRTKRVDFDDYTYTHAPAARPAERPVAAQP